MGFQSSFNQLLATASAGALGYEHIKEQKASAKLQHTETAGNLAAEGHKIGLEEEQLDKDKKALNLEHDETMKRVASYNEQVAKFNENKDNLSKSYRKQRENFFDKAYQVLEEEQNRQLQQANDIEDRILILNDRIAVFNKKAEEVNKIGKQVKSPLKINKYKSLKEVRGGKQ